MRQIKFRVWDEKEERMMTWPDISNYPLWWLTVRNNRILMQFTGLLDKNGKEIYEGDILLCEDDDGELPKRYDEEKDEYFPNSRHVVKWQGHYPAFDLDPNPNPECNMLSYLTGGNGKVEVIGNVWQHADLLSQKNSEREGTKCTPKKMK